MSQATATSMFVKKGSKRGSAASNDWRNVFTIAEGFQSDFPFAEERVARLMKAVHKGLESQRTKDSVHTEELEWIRASLATMFAGTIEQALRKLPVTDRGGAINEDSVRVKRRFGRLWRRNEQYYFTAEQLSELKDSK